MKLSFSGLVPMVNGLTLRERAILLVAVVVLIGVVAYQFFVDPLLRQGAQHVRDAVAWEQESRDAKQRLFAAQARATAAQRGVASQTLKSQINERKAAIAAALSNKAGLSSADAMAVAKTLVKSHPAVALKEMTLQAPQSIVLGEGPNQVFLVQQDMLLSVEGSYLPLVAYLQGLEQSLPGMRWSMLHVEQKKDMVPTVLTVKMSHVQLAQQHTEKGP